METIKINGKDFTIEELNELVKKAKKENPMKEVFDYHNTTEEKFNELYKNIPTHVKAFQKECMIVEFYNKGEKPDWSNSNQSKYYPYFDMNNFSYVHCFYFFSNSHVSARLCFLREKDLLDAVEKFINVYKESRL